MQAFALGKEPIIVTARQKIAVVQVDGMREGFGRAGLSNGVFKFGDIQGKWRVRLPLHGLRVALQEKVRSGHGLAQAMNPDA
jgi:hypothetical protein